MREKKMGLGAVIAIVLGSQIGSAIFLLPSNLASYGMFGIYGWAIAGLGAILLAIIFASLCAKNPKTGGPHVYVNEAFGRLPAFFVGWTYWLVSWVSTSIVVIASIGYLYPFIGNQSDIIYLYLEIALLIVITCINCYSVSLAGRVEFVLSFLKFIPFVIVPIIAFCNFNIDNIQIAEAFRETSPIKMLSFVTVLSFWGFVGVESATTPAENVENPSVTIPKAILYGTICVILVYSINSTAIMGAIPGAALAASKAPYVDVIESIVGKNASLIMAVVASIVCIGTLNAWVLTSAQISLGLAQDGLLPKAISTKNKNGSPYISVIISNIGMIPILVLTRDADFSKQLGYIIDFSVISFFLVYIVCCAAFLKLTSKNNVKNMISGVCAFAFCCFMLYEASVEALGIAFLFSLSGVFVLPFVKIRDPNPSCAVKKCGIQ